MRSQKVELEFMRADAGPARQTGRANSKAKPSVVWTKKTTTLVVEFRHPDSERPMKLVAAVLARNAIGEPLLAVNMKAVKGLEAYELQAIGFDKFGDEIKAWGFGDSEHRAMSQTSQNPGTDHTAMWTPHGSEGVGVVKCRVVRVKLADGSIWKPDDESPFRFHARFPPSDE